MLECSSGVHKQPNITRRTRLLLGIKLLSRLRLNATVNSNNIYPEADRTALRSRCFNVFSLQTEETVPNFPFLDF